MSTEKMRVAMVGVGGFGGYRRDRMRESGLFEIVAAYDLNQQALADAEQRDGAKPVGSYAELLDTPGIEAMVISTGGKFHAEQALQAMDRGLHVFVEKPLCSTMEETLALLKKQQETGLVVGMGHNDHSSDPGFKRLKELIASGELGNLATFEMVTAHSGGLEIRPGDWRGDPDKNPGGMLFQCGVHMIYWFEAMFGRITEVACMMRYDVNPNTKTSDATTVLLRAESGLLATLTAYHVTAYRHTKSLFGTNGNIYINETPEEVFYQARSTEGKPEPVETVDLSTVHAGPMAGNTNVITWAKAIRGDGTPTPSIYDGASAVAVIFAAEESSRTGRIVAVPDVRARVAAG